MCCCSHWYYEDFIRPENPSLPSMVLRAFSAKLFAACPLLQRWSHRHEEAFDEFLKYKTSVPVCGGILLNSTWDKVRSIQTSRSPAPICLPIAYQNSILDWTNSAYWSKDGRVDHPGVSRGERSTRTSPCTSAPRARSSRRRVTRVRTRSERKSTSLYSARTTSSSACTSSPTSRRTSRSPLERARRSA